MAEAIRYCERCARLIPPGDLEDGRASVTDRGAFCAACVEALDSLEPVGTGRAAAPPSTGASGPGRPGARPGARSGARSRRSSRADAPSARVSRAGAAPARAAPAGPQRKAVLVGVVSFGATVLLVVVVALLVSGGDRTERREAPPLGEEPPRFEGAVPAPPPAAADAAAPDLADPAAAPAAPPPDDVADAPADAAPVPTALPAMPEANAGGEAPAASAPAADGDDFMVRHAASLLAQAKEHRESRPDDAWGYRRKLELVRSNYAGTAAAGEAERLLEALGPDESAAKRAGPAEDARPFTEAGGKVVMEAEHFTASAPGRGPTAGVSWQRVRDEGASGGTALCALPNRGANAKNDLCGPRLDYKVRFSRSGKYRVWVRGKEGPNDNNDDSFHVGLDGKPVTTGKGWGVAVTSAWGWTSSVASGDPEVSVKVPSAGVHTLSVWMREDGTSIDKIVLTASAGKPEGLGPAESSRAGATGGDAD